MAKTATLTSSLMARKGEAMPAIAVKSPVVNEPTSAAAKDAAAKDYYKALTVKLDRERYETLKNVGVKLDKKSQEIFVEALDLWLKQAASQPA